MKYVYVLENDSKAIADILESLKSIDPTLQPRIFSSLESFANWIQLLTKDGKKAIAVGGFGPDDKPGKEPSDDDQLVLLVSNNDILGKKHLPLLKKTQDLFILKGLCTKENPTALVITAFDSPDFDAQTIEARLVNNVISKPFDKLILKQHLIFAIGGRQPPTAFTLHNQKTSAIIEMLKDVEIEAYSEVGFITRSVRALPVGAVAKYYGDVFKVGSTRSAFARCFRCEPDPQKPKEFIAGFTYFGTDPEQITSFRKNAQTSEKKGNELSYEYSWGARIKSQIVNIAIVDPEEFGSAPLAGTLERLFSNVRVFKYKNMVDFLTDIDPKSRPKVDKQPPAFPGGRIKFYFEPNLHKLLRLDPALPSGSSVFGMKADEFLKIDFIHWIPEDQRPKLIAVMKGQAKGSGDNYLLIPNGDMEFFIRMEGVRGGKDEKGKPVIEITFVEVQEAEKSQWLAKKSQLPRVVHGVIFSEMLMDSDQNRVQQVKELLTQKAASSPEGKGFKSEFFLVAKQRKKDPELRSLGQYYVDIFYRPVDRSYFIKKMNLFFRGLEAREPDKVEIKQQAKKDRIEVGNPIKAIQISEAGLVMTYYRPIHIGSFRKFVLWFPLEVGLPVILGACNFSEESPETKGQFNNHFVFYGIKDVFLQHIRIWLRENYVMSKKDE